VNLQPPVVNEQTPFVNAQETMASLPPHDEVYPTGMTPAPKDKTGGRVFERPSCKHEA